MSYNGYLIEINGLRLPYVDGANIFENGSYGFSKEHRDIYDWTDVSGKIHHEVSTDERAVIKFKIKERNLKQQQLLRPLFERTENIHITYFDDYLCEYAEGDFFIDNKSQTTGIATADDIFYKSEEITLKEY